MFALSLAALPLDATAKGLEDLRRQAAALDVSGDAAVASPTASAVAGGAPACRTVTRPAADAEVLSAASLPSYKVVILNENHFGTAHLAQPDLIRKIKALSPATDCLYMEFMPGQEPRREDKEDGYDAFAEHWRAAFALGLRIVFVDGKMREAPSSSADPHGNISVRNPDMSARIASSLKSGACRAGILVVGKSHDASSIAGKPLRSIQNLLGDQGVPAYSIDLVDLAFGAFSDGSLSGYAVMPPGSKELVSVPNKWETDYASCADGGRSFVAGTGFIGRKEPEACRTPLLSGAGTVCDYDATLFY